MPIISNVGRKSFRVRLLIGTIYTILILGAATMVYPFVLLVSGSVKSSVDMTQYDMAPRYLYDDVALFRKYAEEKYGYSARQMNDMYSTDFGQVEDVVPPAVYSTALLQDWKDFMLLSSWPEYFPEDNGELPLDMFVMRFYWGEPYRTQWMHMAWQDFLEDRYGTVENFNRACSENRNNFLEILPFPVLWHTRRYQPDASSQYYKDFMDFKAQQRHGGALRFMSVIPFDGIYWSEFIGARYGGSIEQYNKTHGTRLTTFREIRLSEHVPSSPTTTEEWREYISDPWRVRNLRLTAEGQGQFAAYVASRYESFEALAAAYRYPGTSLDGFTLDTPVGEDSPGPAYADFVAFLMERDPWDDVFLQTVNDWVSYVGTELGIRYIRIDKAGLDAFKAYLKEVYTRAAELEPDRRPLDILADRYGIADTSPFAGIDDFLAQYALPQPIPRGGRATVDVDDFLRDRCPPTSIQLITPDILFAKYLQRRYGTIQNLLEARQRSLAYPLGNRATLLTQLSPLGKATLAVLKEENLGGLLDLFSEIEKNPDLLKRIGQPSKENFRLALSGDDALTIAAILDIDSFDAERIESFRDVRLPERARDWETVQQQASALRLHYLGQNYRQVLREIVVHGWALFNTVVFVLGSILLALIVNPLAAYALSRYQLPSTYKILLFFMATMAFPAEVTMIPGFLLLKRFPIAYLVQGAILFALFFAARATIKPVRPRVWALVEAVLLVGTTGLVVAALTDKTGALANRLAFPEDGYWHYALLPVLALSAALLTGGLVSSPWRNRLRGLNGVAWAVVLAVTTLVLTPLAARVFGLNTSVSLLNTFWALLLPGMANGFSIFLLKGFFDSLPQNLYESAQLEGATELWMFRNITLPLSKPIMAVVALQTFTLAYTTFMYAFLVCQDERMWTLMVYIYEMQLESPQYVVFASLIVAAIPTLTVFILAQRVIMRGIIIPVEK